MLAFADAQRSEAMARPESGTPFMPAERRAHVLVVGNEKGGAGKSTIAMHLTIALMRSARRVGIIDLDLRQRTLSRYLENRARWGETMRLTLSAPQSYVIAPNADPSCLDTALAMLDQTTDFIVIDAPGFDNALSRAAHAQADTLVTPLNDSFIDFDLLGEVDPESHAVVRPSLYAEMVWACRKQRALTARKPIDWIVTRTRVATGTIESRNKQRVGDALKALSTRIGFRLAPGLSERVVFREMFPRGLTLIDLIDAQKPSDVRMADLAARQELRDLFITLKLPGLDGQPLAF
jgi:chromosome partitioning protein